MIAEVYNFTVFKGQFMTAGKKADITTESGSILCSVKTFDFVISKSESATKLLLIAVGLQLFNPTIQIL